MIHEIVESYTGRAVENPDLSLKDLKHLLRVLNRGAHSVTGEIKYAIACQLPNKTSCGRRKKSDTATQFDEGVQP